MRNLRMLVVPIVAALVALTIYFVLSLLQVLVTDYRNRTQLATDLLEIGRIMSDCEACNTAPPQTLVEGTSGDNIRAPERFKRGIDPWGTAYSYNVKENPGKDVVIYDVTVRSFGPNRSDDGGAADDLRQTYHVFVLQNGQDR